MDVISDGALAEKDDIAFNAGSHTELIKLAYKDFLELVKPKVATFSLSR
jgi:Ala-tRNA(Pro) deacylase